MLQVRTRSQWFVLSLATRTRRDEGHVGRVSVDHKGIARELQPLNETSSESEIDPVQSPCNDSGSANVSTRQLIPRLPVLKLNIFKTTLRLKFVFGLSKHWQ